MRNFGIEIEMAGITKEATKNAIKNAGLKVQIEGYNHDDHVDGTWKIVEDGSVRGGHEIVSPILSGEEGLKEAMRVANAVEAAGATINRSCGLHVHFNALDLTVEELRMICKRYMAHEAEIDKFMPQSRRADANRFCLSLKRFFANNRAFETAKNATALAASQGSRYCKVNLKAYLVHHTIEFRQHSGTVDAQKIACWVRFLDEFITESIRQARAEAASIKLQPAQIALIDLIKNDDGENAEALQTMLGLQAHSLRGAISILRKKGISITSRRANGKTWYKANMTAEPEADSLFKGISSMVADFYKMRAIALAA